MFTLTPSSLQTQSELLTGLLDERDVIMEEILGLEAPPASPMCANCSSHAATIRCTDCCLRPLLCTECCLKTHILSPFHKIDVWDDSEGCYRASSLTEHGFVLSICRHHGPCSHTESSASGIADGRPGVGRPGVRFRNSSFTPDEKLEKLWVVASTGIFSMLVRWCHCVGCPPRHVQLLKCGLFPSSSKSPRTAFTWEVLDKFWLDSLECHTAARSFYSKLRHLTNPCFPHEVQVSKSCLKLCVYTYEVLRIAIVNC